MVEVCGALLLDADCTDRLECLLEATLVAGLEQREREERAPPEEDSL